jgi:pantothenate kinase type III
MSDRFLTVDLGNSRCKLRAWVAPFEAVGGVSRATVASAAEFDTNAALAAEVRAWTAPFARATGSGAPIVAVSSVASPAVEAELVAALRSMFSDRVLVSPECGLSIEVENPESVGRDRLYAARGAFELVRGAAIVVDAGTALTVDALGLARARGCFLGGAIAPGPRLLADSLARHAARLPLIEPAVSAHALGRDTRGALQAGVVVGFRGAARELALRIAAESQLSGAPIVVTGGARAFLLEPSPCFEGDVREDAELVHRGLLAAARDARSAP